MQLPLSAPCGRPFRRGSTWLLPVPGHRGLFASSHGWIWSNRRGEGNWTKLRTGRTGCQKWDTRGGYWRINCRDHSQDEYPVPVRSFSVHVLVAAAWHGPRPEGWEVDHKNDDHLDNRPDNLQYLPAEENNAKRSSGGMRQDEDWEDMI